MDEAAFQKLRDDLAQAQKRADDEAAARAAEKKRADDEAAARAAEKKRADDEAAARAAEKKRADESEATLAAVRAETSHTVYSEYLHNIQTELPSQLRPETNLQLAAGGQTNVAGKVYPRILRRWADFPEVHRRQFDFLTTEFGNNRIFQPRYAVQLTAESLSPRARRNELDVRPFIREFLEIPARTAVHKFLQQTQDPRYAGLDFAFSNNAYGASQRDLASGSTDIGAANSVRGSNSAVSAVSARGSIHSRSSAYRKRKFDSPSVLVPDRWGIRERPTEANSTGYVADTILPGEYKAVHKLPGSVIRSVLGNDAMPPAESFIDDYARRSNNSGSSADASTEQPQPQHEEPTTVDSTSSLSGKIKREDAVARTICQTYHYMIVYGTQYGYFTSGEATVFLMTMPDSPDTLLYHFVDHALPTVPMARPAIDVVHVAGAQMATLVLEALVAEFRGPAATAVLLQELPRWPSPQSAVGSAAISESSERGQSPGPDGNSGRGNSEGGRQTRQRGPLTPNSGNDGVSGSASGWASSGTTGAPPRPLDRFEAPREQYCTQACMLGLCYGGPLDPNCPNTPEHARAERQKTDKDGTPCHAISAREVRSLVLEQLTCSLSAGVECLARYGLYGAIGTLFKVTLCAYGYTFVAKGVQDAHAKTLRREAAFYANPVAQKLQGVLIPVCLGVIELEEWPYFLPTGACVWHLMFLSWVGMSLVWRVPAEVEDVDQAIHRLAGKLYYRGINHLDLRTPNVAWNKELGHLMALDFDQACFVQAANHDPKPEPTVENETPASPAQHDTKLETAAVPAPADTPMHTPSATATATTMTTSAAMAKTIARTADSPVEKRKYYSPCSDGNEDKRQRM